jgi:adenosylcobinamide kinase/adenosylcobinamide-phosphate guanylyltransferase
MSIVLLLGGVRAGKSARAVQLAADVAQSRPVLFVATAQAFDDEMRQRISAHRRERPARWQTLEAPLDPAGDLRRHLDQTDKGYGAIVVDCLTVWVGNLLMNLPDDADAEWIASERVSRLMHVLRGRDAIVVSNEVGLGVVPPTPLGRRYRDALGRANQLAAAAADIVTLMVAGIELSLKPRK